MAIATDLTYNIEINQQTVDTIGLSKTLDNYSTDELKNAIYCAMYNIARRNNVLRTTNYGWVGAFDKDTGVFQYPFKIQPSSNTYIWDTGATGYNTPDGIYSGVIWLRRENGLIPESVITTDNISQYRMVTEWNVNNFVFNVPSLSTAYTEVSSAEWSQKNYPCCYVPDGWGRMVYHTDRDGENDETVDTPVYPYSLFIFNDVLFLHAIKIERGFIYNSTSEIPNKIFGDSGHWSIDKTTTIATSYNNNYLSDAFSGSGYNRSFNLSGYPNNNRFPATWQGPGGYAIWYQIGGEDRQNYLTLWDHSGYQSYGGYIRINSYFSKLSDVLLYFANMGVYFYTDKLYKPIIANGVVTGFTFDTSIQSDIDNWDGSTINHNVPITPPSPTERIEDKELDMSTLMLSGSAGMVHYYEINKTGTATANQISDAISRFDISTIGKDLMRNLISYKAFAVLPTSSVFNNIIHVAGKDLKDENDNYLTGDVVLGMSKLSLGTIAIPTLYNDYRDYEPYTRIEMFVPFCGWFALPSWAMGKTITGEMFVDLYNGTCKAIIKASGTVVAEIGGNVAYDIPFVAESTGAKAGAVISSALTTAVATAGFAATPNIATGAAALSSAANLASAVNSNHTTLKGVLGDGSNVNGLNRCFIKVTRPQSPNGSTAIPDSYKHEIGVPTMKEIKISAGDGYIQVMDAKVTGNMTAREKQMIIDGFRHGLNF